MSNITAVYCDMCDDLHETSDVNLSPFRWAGKEDVIDNCYKIFRAYSYGLDVTTISEWAYGSRSVKFISTINDIISGKRYGNYTLDAVMLNNSYATVSLDEAKQISEFLQNNISDPDRIILETAEFIIENERSK